MAGSNDFTGQNIQDTYQRVLQLSSSGQLADGTGSLVPLLQVTASHAISASIEIIKEVSSSFADTAATLVLQPSISVTNITASGDISARGDISASGTIDADRIDIQQKRIIYTDPNIEIKDTGLEIGGNVTASGDISASGDILASSFKSRDKIIGLYHDSSDTVRLASTVAKTRIDGKNIELDGPVTASGDISSSGRLTSAFITTGEIIGPGSTGVALNLNTSGDLGITVGTGKKLFFNEGANTNTSFTTQNENEETTFTVNSDSGNVTASGNISASGDDYVFGNVTIDNGKTFIGNTTNEADSNNLLTVGGGSGTSIKLYSTHTGTGRDVGLHMSASANGQEYSIGLARTQNAFYIAPTGPTIGPENAVFKLSSTGNITASGDISASGTIVGSNLSGTNTGDQNLTNLAVTGSDVIFNHITASGNISSSGRINTTNIIVDDVNGTILTHNVGGFSYNILERVGSVFHFGDNQLTTHITGSFVNLTPVNRINLQSDTTMIKNAAATNILRIDTDEDFADFTSQTNLNSIRIGSNITASGDISSSGIITTSELKGAGAVTGFETSGYLSSSALFVGDGVSHISASQGTLSGSGNIVGFVSASINYITASRIDVDGDTIKVGGETFNKTLLLNVKDGFDDSSRNQGKGSAVFKGGIQVAHVTASGDISASGTFIASNLSGTNTGDQNITNLAVTGSDVIFNHVTASGNVSASGDVIGHTFTHNVGYGGGRAFILGGTPARFYTQAGDDLGSGPLGSGETVADAVRATVFIAPHSCSLEQINWSLVIEDGTATTAFPMLSRAVKLPAYVNQTGTFDMRSVIEPDVNNFEQSYDENRAYRVEQTYTGSSNALLGPGDSLCLIYSASAGGKHSGHGMATATFRKI